MARYTEDAAREYSEAMGMIGAGWWRQVAWAHRQGIPAALGMTTRDWVAEFVGGWQRLPIGGRREAVMELTTGPEALSQRAAADVLGVSPATVNEDIAVQKRTPGSMVADTDRSETNDLPMPTGRYRCIVIDPPWPMERIERHIRPKDSKDLDYRTMTLAEIAGLPIGDLAEQDGCHVYLWTTQRFLPDALGLMRTWGVEYQCLMTWIKNIGMTPYSWMYDTEHVVFGRVGNLKLLELGLRLSFRSPREGHSVKPDVFYERVGRASPGPRLEMFARRTHEGFEPWGDEAEQAS